METRIFLKIKARGISLRCFLARVSLPVPHRHHRRFATFLQISDNRQTAL